MEPCFNERGDVIQFGWCQRWPRVGVEEPSALVSVDDVTRLGETVDTTGWTRWGDTYVGGKDGSAVVQMGELTSGQLVEAPRFCLGTAMGIVDHGPVVRVGEEAVLPRFDLDAVDGIRPDQDDIDVAAAGLPTTWQADIGENQPVTGCRNRSQKMLDRVVFGLVHGRLAQVMTDWHRYNERYQISGKWLGS